NHILKPEPESLGGAKGRPADLQRIGRSELRLDRRQIMVSPTLYRHREYTLKVISSRAAALAPSTVSLAAPRFASSPECMDEAGDATPRRLLDTCRKSSASVRRMDSARAFSSHPNANMNKVTLRV